MQISGKHGPPFTAEEADMVTAAGTPAYRAAPARPPVGYQTMSSFGDVLVPVLLVYAILLPAGLAVQLGSVALPPYGLATLLLLPFAFAEMVRRRISPTVPDILIIAGSFWGLGAMIVTSGVADGIEAGGSFVVDGLGCYLIGRAYLTDVRRLRKLLVAILPGVLVITVILVIEAVSHKLLIAPLFPQRAALWNLYETRFGLLRARAVFPHSIAAGLFMGSLLSLYFMSRLGRSGRNLGVLAASGALFTGSSAAYLTIAGLSFLMAYKSFFNLVLRTRERLIYLFYAAVLLLGFLEMFTGRGAIRTLINFLAFDKGSAYYRLLIWTYGTASVEKHPLFGIGNAALPRPRWMLRETIDNHWLALAVRYGLPTAVLIGLGVMMAVAYCVMRNTRLNDYDRTTTLGAVFALLALSLMAWTSGLWANHVAWYMLIAGTVAALANQLPKRQHAPARRPQPPRVTQLRSHRVA